MSGARGASAARRAIGRARWSAGCVALGLLAGAGVACGDDDAPPADAAVDAGDVDLGPTPRDAGPMERPPTDICDPSAPPPGPYPEPGAFPPNRGPGIGRVSFREDQLFVHCAYLDGGDIDVSDHHNLAVMNDGYLVLPAAPEYGGGSITLWDLSDPCRPVRVGYGESRTMRETHAIGFSREGGMWAAVDGMERIARVGGSGIQIWDLSDPTAPRAVADLSLPGAAYPDAYARVPLSVFWQGTLLWVAGADNGFYVVDVSDPRAPYLARRVPVEPTLRVGQIQAIGTLLVLTAAEGARTVLMDVSDPTDPQPIPGGDFDALDDTGAPREAYFTNTANGYIYYAPKQGGGGLSVMDIRDPFTPRFAGHYRSRGNGGYVMVHEDYAFVGESSFATIYDISDLSNIRPFAELDLAGDLDTMYPVGHLAVLSVDDEAETDRGTAIAPWQQEPDGNPPRVTFVWPADGATGVRTRARLGFTANEAVDPGSAWAGSVRLYEEGADPAATRVDGVITVQEAIVSFQPRCPLRPRTTYALEVPAGGLRDYAGNAIAEAFRATFTTGVE